MQGYNALLSQIYKAEACHFKFLHSRSADCLRNDLKAVNDVELLYLSDKAPGNRYLDICG